jgi:hypothetical protein
VRRGELGDQGIVRFWGGCEGSAMEPSMSSSSTPTHRSRSSSGSFDGSSMVFRDLDDGSRSVAGGSDAGFSLDESYNPIASFKANGGYEATGSYNAGGGSSRGGNRSGSGGGGGGGRWRMVRGLVIKAACLIGGAFLLRKLTKSTTRWDHARMVAQALSGEKVGSSLSHINFGHNSGHHF